MALRLVTFDITNTIIRISGGAVGNHYAKIGRLYGVDMDSRQLQSAFKENYTRHSEQYPNFGINSGLSPFLWWSSLVIKCFQCSGYSGDEMVLKNIASHLYKYFSTDEGWERLSGCDVMLECLKRRGLKLGVISNFDNRLETILINMSLRHYFDFVLSATELRLFKPDPEIFKRALLKGDTDGSKSLHVGDSVTSDYFGAKNAGLHALLFFRGGDYVPDGVDPDCIIMNLGELIGKLDEIDIKGFS